MNLPTGNFEWSFKTPIKIKKKEIAYSLSLFNNNKTNATAPSNNDSANVIFEDIMNGIALLAKVSADPMKKPHIIVNMARAILFPTSLFVDSIAEALLKSFSLT